MQTRGNTISIAALTAGGLLLAQTLTRPRRTSKIFNRSTRTPDTLQRELDPNPSVGLGLAAAAAVAAGGLLLSQNLRRGSGSGSDAESTVVDWIEVDVPISTAYNQWTQFEEFPKFMASVEWVKQIDDTHLRWRAVVGGKMKEWEAEITEQIPDQRIAWRSTGGVQNSGVVTFHKISDSRTRVLLQMDYLPESFAEKLGDAVGGVKLTTKGNLNKFKHLVEGRGSETGAWRETISRH